MSVDRLTSVFSGFYFLWLYHLMIVKSTASYLRLETLLLWKVSIFKCYNFNFPQIFYNGFIQIIHPSLTSLSTSDISCTLLNYNVIVQPNRNGCRRINSELWRDLQHAEEFVHFFLTFYFSEICVVSCESLLFH